MCENHQSHPGTTQAEAPTPESPVITAGSCCAPTADAADAGAGSCCTGESTAVQPAQQQDGVAECPVMAGTPVNKAQAEAAGLYRDYKGQRYWFCCAACGLMWDADPDEYAAA